MQIKENYLSLLRIIYSRLENSFKETFVKDTRKSHDKVVESSKKSIDALATVDTITELAPTLVNVESTDTLTIGSTNVDQNKNGTASPDGKTLPNTVSSAGVTPIVTITHAGTDSGSGLTADGTVATVNVAKADDAINITVIGNTVLFTEGAGATTSLFNSNIDTIETGDTISEVVLTLANVEFGDILTFGVANVDLNTNGATGPDGNGFVYTVSSTGASPVVTITHAGTDNATVSTMLNSIVFNNTTNNNPISTARTVTLTSATDYDSGLTSYGTVAIVNVAKTDDANNIITTGNVVFFTKDAGATTPLSNTETSNAIISCLSGSCRVFISEFSKLFSKEFSDSEEEFSNIEMAVSALIREPLKTGLEQLRFALITEPSTQDKTQYRIFRFRDSINNLDRAQSLASEQRKNFDSVFIRLLRGICVLEIPGGTSEAIVHLTAFQNWSQNIENLLPRVIEEKKQIVEQLKEQAKPIIEATGYGFRDGTRAMPLHSLAANNKSKAEVLQKEADSLSQVRKELQNITLHVSTLLKVAQKREGGNCFYNDGLMALKMKSIYA